MPRGHALGNVGNNFGNAAHDVGRKDLIRMKDAQGLSVVVLFGHRKDYAAKAKASAPLCTHRAVCVTSPNTIAIAMDRQLRVALQRCRFCARPKRLDLVRQRHVEIPGLVTAAAFGDAHGAATVFVDELDADGLQNGSDFRTVSFSTA